MSKKQLLIITNDKCDKNSFSYIKQIEKIKKEYYNDDIDLMQTKVKSQEDFESVLNAYSGSVLCIEPHDFEFPNNHAHRNIERDQVITATLRYLFDEYKFKKILIIGSGKIGNKLHSDLVDLGRIACLSRYRDINYLSDDFVAEFDAIVNCASYDSRVELFYTGLVIDLAGTFYTKPKTYVDVEKRIKTVETPECSIITRGVIGKATTQYMLEDVIYSD